MTLQHHRPHWTLRRRLVVVVVALLAVVAATIGVVSTLALRSSLISQIDTRLAAASQRAIAAPDRFNGFTPNGTPTIPNDAATTPAGTAPTDTATATTDPGTITGFPYVDGSDVPPALGLPGQDVGTVNVLQNDDVTKSGYLDSSGTSQPLTDEQLDLLLAVDRTGEPITVELPELGTFRVVAQTSDEGTTSVTALPLTDVTSAVDRFLAVEIAVGLAGLLIGASAAAALVRRELRPLDRVADTAARVANMPLSRGEVELADRVPEQDSDPNTEVGKVGWALNRMLGHVESALTARHESETQVRRFVADASHELRTPLASIRGYAELVQRLPAELPEDAVRAMNRVESEARRMTALVEDMLLLARLDAGRDLDLREVDFSGLVIDAVADAHVAGPDHVWRLDLGDPDQEDPPPPVFGDEHRLRQVLLNLLTNARVHTPPGTEVTVSVRTEPAVTASDKDTNSGTRHNNVVLRVADTGPGIPEPLQSRLFERFARGDASRNRAEGSTSTGLGLAIVNAVITAHQGTIEVESTPSGTSFVVRLPPVDQSQPSK